MVQTLIVTKNIYQTHSVSRLAYPLWLDSYLTYITNTICRFFVVS